MMEMVASSSAMSREAAGSKYGLWNMCPRKMPRKAMNTPVSPALSSRKTVKTVGSLLPTTSSHVDSFLIFASQNFAVRNPPGIEIEYGSDREYGIAPAHARGRFGMEKMTNAFVCCQSGS